MNLMTLPAGRAVCIRASVIGVRAPDGARLRIRVARPATFRVVATGRFARDPQTRALRRQFLLIDPPLVPGVTRVWVTERARPAK
jgi:hypothetical protein